MYVFPHPIANGQNQVGTIAGKLNGATQKKTPSGCLMTISSIPDAMSSVLYPI